MNRALRALVVFAACIGSSISAGATPPPRLAKTDISPRILRVHRVVLQLLPLIVKGGGRHDSTSTIGTMGNCAGGGSFNATVSASSASTGTSSSGSASYNVTFTNCTQGDDTLNGNMTFTYSSSASNGGATNTITVSYSKANVLLKSVSTSPVVLQGMTISTVATTTTTSGGGTGGTTTKNTASGTVNVGGTTYTYSGDPLDVPYGG